MGSEPERVQPANIRGRFDAAQSFERSRSAARAQQRPQAESRLGFNPIIPSGNQRLTVSKCGHVKASPKKPLEPMLSTERRAVGLVALIAVLRMFGLFALLPILALYVAGLEGATPLLVGIAVGGHGLTQAGLQIPLGALSDRIGRLPVIVGGLLVFAAGSFLAAGSESIYGVISGRLLQGAGAISATLTAFLTDVTRPFVRTRAMAILGVGIGAAFLLALVAGPAIAAVGGARSLFVIAGVVAILAALLAFALPKPTGAPVTARGSLASAFRPQLLRLDLYVLLLHGMLTALFVGLPFLLSERLGLALGEHWQIYVIALLLSLIGTVPLILADDRQGKRGTVQIALLLLFIGACLLAFAANGRLLIVAGLAIFFAGFNFLEAGLPARLSLVAPSGARGASLGVFASAQFLGIFLGGLAGGALLSAGRPTDVLMAAAVLTGVWVVLHRWPRESQNVADSPEI